MNLGLFLQLFNSSVERSSSAIAFFLVNCLQVIFIQRFISIKLFQILFHLIPFFSNSCCLFSSFIHEDFFFTSPQNFLTLLYALFKLFVLIASFKCTSSSLLHFLIISVLGLPYFCLLSSSVNNRKVYKLLLCWKLY